MSLERIPHPPSAPVSCSSVAAELVTAADQAAQADTSHARDHAMLAGVRLDSSTTLDGIEAVVRASTLAMMNHRVSHPGLSGRPSNSRSRCCDCVLRRPTVFVCRDGGHRSVVLRHRRAPLPLKCRCAPARSPLHMVFDHMIRLRDSAATSSWAGGEVVRRQPAHPKMDAIANGANAVATRRSASAGAGVASGLRVLSLAEPTIQGSRLWATAVRCCAREVSRAAADAIGVDFSGWVVFVRDDAPDALVRQICAALEARRTIPVDGDGRCRWTHVLRCARGAARVSAHPAADRFWRERGYIR